MSLDVVKSIEPEVEKAYIKSIRKIRAESSFVPLYLRIPVFRYMPASAGE